VLSYGRRLFMAGYSRDNVLKGMQDVVDERESLRAALRADPTTLRRRRTTLIVAFAQLAAAAVLLFAAFRQRVELSPGTYGSGLPGMIMLFSAMLMLGMGMALLARNPMRMSLGERIFRRLWLGPIGRSFLAVAARGVETGDGGPLTPLVALSRHTAPVSVAFESLPPARTASPVPQAIQRDVSERSNTPPAAGNGAAGDSSVGDDALAQLEQRVAKLEEWQRRADR